MKTMGPAELMAFKQLPPGTPITITYRRGTATPKDVQLTLAAE